MMMPSPTVDPICLEIESAGVARHNDKIPKRKEYRAKLGDCTSANRQKLHLLANFSIRKVSVPVAEKMCQRPLPDRSGWTGVVCGRRAGRLPPRRGVGDGSTRPGVARLIDVLGWLAAIRYRRADTGLAGERGVNGGLKGGSGSP
jgi:hypothetical protein